MANLETNPNNPEEEPQLSPESRLSEALFGLYDDSEVAGRTSGNMDPLGWKFKKIPVSDGDGETKMVKAESFPDQFGDFNPLDNLLHRFTVGEAQFTVWNLRESDEGKAQLRVFVDSADVKKKETGLRLSFAAVNAMTYVTSPGVSYGFVDQKRRQKQFSRLRKRRIDTGETQEVNGEQIEDLLVIIAGLHK